MAIIVAVSRSEQHGFSKSPQPFVRLIAGEGVADDAHRGATTQHLYLKRKDPTKPNLAQVHLFAAERLDELAALGFVLAPGEMGENILVRGFDLHALPTGTRLHLGAEALIEITGERTPCSQIDQHRTGLQQHLWGPRDASGQRQRRAGVMAIVLAGGVVTAEDPVRVTLPPAPHQPLGPV